MTNILRALMHCDHFRKNVGQLRIDKIYAIIPGRTGAMNNLSLLNVIV